MQNGVGVLSIQDFLSLGGWTGFRVLRVVRTVLSWFRLLDTWGVELVIEWGSRILSLAIFVVVLTT
jgi:hypothetical protein